MQEASNKANLDEKVLQKSLNYLCASADIVDLNGNNLTSKQFKALAKNAPSGTNLATFTKVVDGKEVKCIVSKVNNSVGIFLDGSTVVIDGL